MDSGRFDLMFEDTELAESVRRTAYFLWEQDGRPEGLSQHYWLAAKEFHLRQLAYDRWLAEGAPEGRAGILADAAQDIDPA